MPRSNLPMLVLLPGMDGTGELFQPFIAALKNACDIVVVAYPCDIPLNYEALTAIAAESLPTDQPFVLLGESFSGPIALSLSALRLPHQVGLVLCCTFASNPRPLLQRLGFLINLLPLGLVSARWLSPVLLGRFANAFLSTALSQAINKVSPSVMRERLRSVLNVDRSKQLGQVNVPTLYLRATDDRVVPETTSTRIARLKPQVQIIDINAPHCLLQAAPYEAARVVIDFLRTTNTP